MNEPVIKASNLHKSYRMGRVILNVLKGVSLEIQRGQFTAIVGASGSGKSTLLHLLGLLDKADKGDIILDGRDVSHMSSRQRNNFRCRDVGFVFQFYHLLPELNVLENVMLPAMVDCPMPAWFARGKKLKSQAMEIIAHLGIKERLKHRPSELSGGERQRVAIARAMINRPGVLLADEPTGNLDSKTGQKIMDVLKEFNKSLGQTIVMVTHDMSLAGQAGRVLHLRDGRLED